MIKNFYNFVNEGYFNFFKKKNKNITYVPVDNMEVFKLYETIQPDLLDIFRKNINNVSFISNIICKMYIYYIQEKLINKTVKINFKNFKNNSFIKREVTIDRCHPEPVHLNDSYFAKIYEKRNYYYVDSYNLTKILIKRKIIRSKIDPYGEENWDD